MPSTPLVPVLVAMMLLTGVCNTVLTKFQDMQCVRHCDSADPRKRQHFEQPVLQTAQMFVGEAGCWLVVAVFKLYRRYAGRSSSRSDGYEPLATTIDSAVNDDSRAEPIFSQETLGPVAKPLTSLPDGRQHLRGWRVVLLALPACCDIAGTTLMNVGLLFVAASIYQMTRGALVLFVGLFSVIFLRRRLHLYQWLALFLVVLGVGLVGLAGALFADTKAVPSAPELKTLAFRALRDAYGVARTPEAVRTIVGILLIAGAQVFTASQFVLEEWILEKYALEPLKVVGWEGVFGLMVTVVGMIILHLAVGRTERGRYGYFDAVEGWRQMTEFKSIGITSLLIMISIGGFNFFGLSVTRVVSATSRSTIDTSRTLFIWIVSLGLGWETFKWLQVLGFALLVYGTFLFNDIVSPPLKRCMVRRKRSDLLPQEPVEHM
ncbi:MAG: hypothetical protein M1825_000165 [Sarcosagium campestre]|nr:MAG: hypothetical protein M1825_000165 [Sarcosagium campestre]